MRIDPPRPDLPGCLLLVIAALAAVAISWAAESVRALDHHVQPGSLGEEG